MAKIVLHPGIKLDKMLNNIGLSQRELSSKIDVAHSVLNQILKGNRNLNVNIAFSLEACGIGNAEDWMKSQMDYLIYKASIDKSLKEKNEFIKTKTELEKLIPLSYFKKQNGFDLSSKDDIKEIFKIYNVASINQLEKNINNYSPKHFRKSSKFSEEPQNVYAWNILAEYIASKKTVESFDLNKESLLVKELKGCFLSNKKTIKKTTEILAKYGIIFFILDRPSKTPVDGKSFLSKNNPAIVLTLKYKRLDNFAFTLMHELGHIFKHLNHSKYKNVSFYTANINTKEENEANEYAKNHLINAKDWTKFDYDNNGEFDSNIIERFAKRISVHPAIVKGRICFEYPKYYKRRIPLSMSNVINDE